MRFSTARFVDHPATGQPAKPLARASRWDGVLCNWNRETEEPLTPSEVADDTAGIETGLEVVTFVERPSPAGDGWLEEFRASVPDLSDVRR